MPISDFLDYKVVCLCPTYNRPRHLIENALYCLCHQDYPGPIALILFDECRHSGLKPDGFSEDCGSVLVYLKDRNGLTLAESAEARESPDSLSRKYRFLHRQAELYAPDAEVVLVWEDDDVYLPHHVTCHVEVLQNSLWSHPREVWSTYGGKVHREQAAGRFHASLGFRAEFLQRIGGWPDTARPNFDQELISRCRRESPEPGRPDSMMPPSYVFRWQDTGSPHYETFFHSDTDESGHQKAVRVMDRFRQPRYVPSPVPDSSCREILRELHIADVR